MPSAGRDADFTAPYHREERDQWDQEECDFFTCRSKQEIETYPSFVAGLSQSLLWAALIVIVLDEQCHLRHPLPPIFNHLTSVHILFRKPCPYPHLPSIRRPQLPTRSLLDLLQSHPVLNLLIKAPLLNLYNAYPPKLPQFKTVDPIPSHKRKRTHPPNPRTTLQKLLYDLQLRNLQLRKFKTMIDPIRILKIQIQISKSLLAYPLLRRRRNLLFLHKLKHRKLREFLHQLRNRRLGSRIME